MYICTVRKERGHNSCPFVIYVMAEIIESIYKLLEPLLDDTDIFIVNIKIKPTNNIKVFLDADGGFTIEKCSSINRRLYAMIEDEQVFPDGDYSLEVSSPGIDEPLLQKRQYLKNVGRKVAITDNMDIEKIGILKEVNEDSVIIEMKLLKQKEVTIVEIPFTNIKKTVVQIIF